MSGKITLRAMNNELFQFQFKTTNGQSIFSGEPRPTKNRALEDANAFRRGVLEDGRYAVFRDRQGRFYFSFLGESGETLGMSVPFPTPEGLGKAIAALKTGAPQADLDDLT